MKATRPCAAYLIYLLTVLMAIPPGILAQASTTTQEAPEFSKEELAQMLAPVALYPDSLLAQMLMASTYPLEVVEAARWIAKNPGLKGDQLDAALQEKDWDVSVKSMTHFPDLLSGMNEQIEETAMLGDAFLAQEKDVMDTIQELRAKAKAQGNLESTQEQKVVVQEKIIVIEPANPEVIYVPTYNPAVVYGPWWYPAYPPYRPYFAYYPGAFAVTFTTGFFVGAFVGSWCRFGWHSHRIDVNINRTVNFNRNVNINRGSGHRPWEHNPNHRKGVAYKDRRTSQRYGQSPSRSRDARREAPGYDRSTRDAKRNAPGLDRGTRETRREATGPDRGTRDARSRDQAGRGGERIQPGAGRDSGGSRGTDSRDRAVSGPRPSEDSKGQNRGRGSAGTVERQRGNGSPQRSAAVQRPQDLSGTGRSSNRGSSAYSGMSNRGASSQASQRGQSSRGGSRGGGGGQMRRR